MIDPRLNFPSTRLSSRYIYPEKKWSLRRRTIRRIVQFLSRRGIKEGRNERKTSGEKAGSQYLDPPPSFKCVMILSFLFFPKYFLSISRIVETRLDFRVVTLRKKKEKKKGKREQKREENRGGDGRKWGRKAKETARRGGKSRAQWREWKGRRRKGWGSERKIDGGGMYHPAHSIFRVSLFCPPRQPDKGPSGEELAARYSPDQLETRCQMENSSE